MSEDDFITCKCPYCGNELEYLKESVGTAQLCPHCSEEIVVPEVSGRESHALPLPIETPRLLLRHLDWQDFTDVVEIFSNDEVFRYDPSPSWEERQVKDWLQETAPCRFTDPRGVVALGIETKSDSKLIGVLSLDRYARDGQQGRWNIQINPQYQRQGFATEAMAGAFNFCFRDLQLHRLVATCHTGNTAAIRLIAKLGMRQEGESIQDCQIDGQWTNTLWFSQLRDEFLGRTEP